MKFSIIGDIHMDANPSTRIDDFNSTKEKKVKEILEIEKKEKINLRISLGDFLNKGVVPSETLSKIITLWNWEKDKKRIYDENTLIENLIKEIELGDKKSINKLKDIMTENNITPMVSVIGNHDLIGNALESYPKTSLNFLEQSGFLTIATKENPIYIKDKSGFTVVITGSNYNYDIDGEDKSAYIVDEKLGDFHIHIVHGMLMDKSYGKKFKHTVISEIAPKTKADLTINGHDHIGYDLTEIDGKYFVNPGSIFRLKADKSEVKRKPKILILDISKDGFKIKKKYLKSAEEGSLVLSREKIESKEKKEAEIEQIKSMINKAGVKKGIDIIEIIENISKTESIPDNIKNNLIDLIVKKKVVLDEPYVPLGKYLISAIELENFGCYEHAYIELSKGLNGFTGESRNGKSTVLRALREIYECYMVNPRNHIRVGADYFKISVYLDNGYIVSRIVDKKVRNGKNGYEVFNPHTGQVEVYNTKGLKAIQEILGYKRIKLNDRNEISVNFINQGEPWFYIGKGLSSPDRGKLAGIVYGTNYADAVLKDITSSAKKINSEISHYNNDIEKLEKTSKTYDFLDDYEKRIKEAENLLTEIEEIKKRKEKVEYIFLKIKKYNFEIKNCEEIITKINTAKQIYTPMLDEINNMISSNQKIKELYESLKEISNSGKMFRYINNNLNVLSEVKDLVSSIDEKQKIVEENKAKLDKYISLKKQLNLITTKGKNVGNLVKNIKNINECKLILDKLVIKQETKDKLVQIKNDLFKITSDINIQENEIKKQKNIISTNLDKYKTMLEGLTECPICRSKIDDVKIKSVLEDI